MEHLNGLRIGIEMTNIYLGLAHTIKRNTGIVFSQERKANVKDEIRRAVENGIIF